MAENKEKVSITERAKIAHQKRNSSFLWRAIIFIFKALTLIFYPVWNRVAKDRLKVVVLSHTNLIFLWPVPIASVVFLWMLKHGYPLELVGWLWILVGLVSVLALLDKLSLAEGLAILGLFTIVWLLAFVVQLKYQIPVLSEVWNYVANTDVKADVGTIKVVGIAAILLIALYSLPHALLAGRYRISSRKVDHRNLLILSSDGTDVQEATPSLEIGNIFRFIIGFGAGSIVFKSGGSVVMLRIDNIFGVYFIYSIIEDIFDSQTIHVERTQAI